MPEIPLTRGMVTIVDDEDFETLSHSKWRASRDRNTFYAERTVYGSGGSGIHERVHRVVLSRKIGRPLLASEFVDHENGDGLDNRRANLRLATNSQNQRNCKRHSMNPSSRYLGISWYAPRKTWRARIQVEGKEIYIGYHASEYAAARARDEYIAAHPGLLARLNFQ